MPRVLLLATTTGYQTRSFGEAAARLGVELVFATDRCAVLDDPWSDHAIAIRFFDEERSIAAILDRPGTDRVDGVLVVGDRPTVIAARVAQALGLPGHSPDAAAIARNKQMMRIRLRDAGLPVPWFQSVAVGDEPAAIRDEPSAISHQPLSYPCIVKPVALSGSRGVMRANDRAELAAAFDRLRALLRSPDIRAERNEAHETALIEEFIPGREYAIEALLHHGELRVLAIFDKPDPLDGPFFEETLYVTPSAAPAAVQDAIVRGVAAAARAIGLHHGPIHAECRVNDSGVFVLEVAARPIGGLCARALRFAGIRDSGFETRHRGLGMHESAFRARNTTPNSQIPTTDAVIPLEELLLRHALGESPDAWTREPDASGVMMIPIPRRGFLRRVDGVDAAREVAHVTDVRITAKPDHLLAPLPEGASYLGFIFARAAAPLAVERALRDAHARLTFAIDPELPVLTASQSRYNRAHG
jgi:hypothetical protein